MKQVKHVNQAPEGADEKDLFRSDWKEDLDDDNRKKLSRVQRNQKRNFWIPCLIVAIALGGASFGAAYWMDHKESSNPIVQLQKAEEKQYNDYVNWVNNLEKPADWDDETFEALKTAALNAYSTADLDELNKAVEGDAEAAAKFEGQTEAKVQEAIKQYEDLFNNAASYPANIVALAKDPGMVAFVLEYPNHVNDPGTDVTLGDVTQQMPDLKTFDPAWGYVPYRDSIMAISGGAPTVIADVFSYCLDDPTITPLAIARWAKEAGYEFNEVSEADDSIFSGAALTYGVPMIPLALYKTQITDHVSQGYPTIIVTGSYEAPKYYALNGVDANGQWIAYDPTTSASPITLDPDATIDSVIKAYSFW